jgi:hypothetical protein
MRSRAAIRRLRARFWTGPIAHLLGGGIDLAGAFARYGVAAARSRRRRL